MLPSRPSVLLLGLSLLGGGAVFAQEEEKGDAEQQADLERIVEEQAEEEEEDGTPADADPGEASYNISNCAPGVESEEGAGEDDPDAIDDCEKIEK